MRFRITKEGSMNISNPEEPVKREVGWIRIITQQFQGIFDDKTEQLCSITVTVMQLLVAL